MRCGILEEQAKMCEEERAIKARIRQEEQANDARMRREDQLFMQQMILMMTMGQPTAAAAASAKSYCQYSWKHDKQCHPHPMIPLVVLMVIKPVNPSNEKNKENEE
jgi:hypothetical protein